MMRNLKKYGLGDKDCMSRWATRAKAFKASATPGASGGRVTIASCSSFTLPMLDKLTFAHDSSGGTKGSVGQ
jgi:hypothetical protein